MANVLIIDDDSGFSLMLAEIVKKQGHKASWAISMSQGVEVANRVAPDIVFLDVRLPDGNGLEGLTVLKDAPSQPEVIVITGFADAQGADSAIRSGAWDYVEKSSTAVQLALSMSRALRFREATRAGIAGLKRGKIVGSSVRMTQALNKVVLAAKGDLPVLLSGESGTGKELFARCIHENSARAKRNLVVVDCAALPEHLIESILFGHVKGAFTGAESASEGLVKAANCGTLFLDEVGELPLRLQKVFLRVLQEHRFRPVGAKAETESDFRLIAATNRDMDAMVAKGLFREDLLYRLRSIELCVPSLREHLEDLPGLVAYHLGHAAAATHTASPELLAELRMNSWPGNVRELFHALDKAAAKAGNDLLIFPEHLPTTVRTAAMKVRYCLPANAAPGGTASSQLDHATLPLYREYRDRAAHEADLRYMHALFTASGGSPKLACELSGLSRTRFYCLAKAHSIRFTRER
jgi:two-component system, NtrC family, response regulator